MLNELFKTKGINLHIVCIIVLPITTDAIDSFFMLYIFYFKLYINDVTSFDSILDNLFKIPPNNINII